MSILSSFIKKQFIEVLQWLESDDDVLVYRFPMQDQEIMNGGVLNVRESQMAVFVNEGQIADVFGPGRHTLTTQNLPLLTNLKNWDKLFQSPFKSDVYFFSTRQHLNRRWATPQPITVRDKEFGAVRMECYGNLSFHIADVAEFHKKVSGTQELYTIDQLDDQLRTLATASVSAHIAASGISFLDMMGNQVAFAAAVKDLLSTEFNALGLQLDSFVIQNFELPKELQAKLDTRIGMNMLGDMSTYTQFQAAEAIKIAAANPGGAAGVGAQLAAGLALGQGMAQAMAAPAVAKANPEPKLSGEEVAKTLKSLHDLVTQGILTQAEFDSKKTELLSKVG